MILVCISVFGFVQLTSAVKLMPLELHGCKYFSVKTATASMFSTVNRKLKFLSTAGRTPKFETSRKP